MSYQYVNGLDLFGDPFSHNSYSKATQPRTTATQQKTPVQQPVKSNSTATRQEPVKTQVQQPYINPATQSKSPVLQQNSGNPIPESKSFTSTKKLTSADVKEQAKTSVPTNAPTPQPAPASKSVTSTKEPQKKELVMDMSSDTSSKSAIDDTAKRKAHEEAEAKRKAEWEAKQLAKKHEEGAAIQKLQNMSDDDIIAASIKRIGTDVERLTRRNMRECVAAHIQELARKDVAFARRTMHPRKNMINCFRYINRMAKEFIEQEMKDNDVKPENGVYGSDVPDGLCYRWAEDYFNSTDISEDQEKEEKFVPKPYTGTTSKTPSKPKKAASNEAKKKPEPKSSGYEQMSFV